MSDGDVSDRYCSEKELGRDGPFVTQLVRLRTDSGAPQLLLKRPSPEVTFEHRAVSAFLETSEKLSAVDAPNLLKIIESGVDRTGLYVVTEYPRHVTLMSLLGRLTFPPLPAAMVVEQAARGLTAAGTIGLPHGALMPQHLWLTSTGIIKIKDFGLHLLFRDVGRWFNGATASYWFDPEVLIGLKPDGRADCYSLGCMLRALLCGGIISKSTEGGPVVASLEDLPEPVSDRLRSILATCLNPDRTRRFGQSKDLLEALNAFLQEEGVIDPVDGLKRFLQQRAKGTGSLERSKQPDLSVPEPDQNPSLLDPAAFWRTEHGEHSLDGVAAASQESSSARSQGPLKGSQGGSGRTWQPELLEPCVDLAKSSEAVSVPKKKLNWSLVPVWLQIVGGILLAAALGGLLGWYLIGRWTLEESDGGNKNTGTTQNADDLDQHAPKGNAPVLTGEKPAVNPPATKEVSDANSNVPQEPASEKAAQPHDQCTAGCGWIYITSVPSGATVELDGNEVSGKTPLLIDNVSANDSHALRVMLSGRKPYQEDVHVKSGDVLNVEIELKKTN